MTRRGWPLPDDAPLLEESALACKVMHVTLVDCTGIDDDGLGCVRSLPHQHIVAIGLDLVALKQ